MSRAYEEMREELYLFPRHICGLNAKKWLFPPNKEGHFQTPGYTISIKPFPHWCIDDGEMRTVPIIYFCPWCGEKLPMLEG